jgi:DNA-binding NarL/FixJ family response regulator
MPAGGEAGRKFDEIVLAENNAVSDRFVQETVLVLDDRLFNRECFCRSLRGHDAQFDIVAAASADGWVQQKDQRPPLAAVIFNIGGRKIGEKSGEIVKAIEQFAPVPVVVLAEAEDLSQIIKALDLGIRGYIPASVGIDVCVEAIRLAIAGGIFVPANAVMELGRAIENGEDLSPPMAGMFTPRQAEVVLALRRGKANKIIAHELNMCESTVKVHIRNIMRKLRATNRTEVAYKINDLFPTQFSARD